MDPGSYDFCCSLLDELPEFDSRSLEVLHASSRDEPVRVVWRPIKPCTCSPANISRYQHKISVPLLDRIDIHLDVTRLDYGS